MDWYCALGECFEEKYLYCKFGVKWEWIFKKQIENRHFVELDESN